MKKLVRALVVGAVAIAPVAALAGIDNTHHDIPYVTTAAAGSAKCGYCHSITGISTRDPLLEKVGNFCVTVCHVTGSGIAATRTEVIPTAPVPYSGFTRSADAVGTVLYGTGAFAAAATDSSISIFTLGHGMNKLTINGSAYFPNEAANIATTAWPYTQNNQLQCTSCHAIHDATNPPFLNAKLDTFCQRCHNSAIRTTTFGTPGNHPILFDWDATAANGRNRDLVNLATANINVMATGITDTSVAGDLNALTANWNLGGHLINPTTGLTVTAAAAGNNFGCVSCHAPHANGGATNPGGTIYTVGGELSTVCFGCHTSEPGRSGMGHPIGGGLNPETVMADSHSWTIPLSAGLTALDGTPYYNSANPPLCVTCHDVHTANQTTNAVNRMAIRIDGALPDTYAATDSVCDACHTGSFTVGAANDQHHPGTVGAGIYPNFPAATSWITQDGNGNLADGLACQDCHVGDGTATHNSTAHNW